MQHFDVIIVGGGPAGLSAALVLGRCRRKVAIFDTGRQRNRSSRGINGFLTRDGIAPSEFLQIAQNELLKYEITFYSEEITSVERLPGGHFKAFSQTGREVASPKILLTSGVVDRIPEIEGIATFYGRSVHHCPYCDGWEHKDEPIAVYGHGKSAAVLTNTLSLWSEDLLLCTDGKHDDGEDLNYIREIEERGIPVYTSPIRRLEGDEGVLKRILFEDGTVVERRALFFTTGHEQHSYLAESLGCRPDRRGDIAANRKQETNVEGVYIAGDAAWDMHLAIVAAAEGAKAAVAINTELLKAGATKPTPSGEATEP